MATVATTLAGSARHPDRLSGTERAGFIDRWIYVFTAASFIVITLTGFIPDSFMKIALIRAGGRAPFPIVLHFHAVLMASFLLLLLAQTTLVAIGRSDLHRRLGIAAFILVPALVVVGFILVPTIYHQVWNAIQTASPENRTQLEKVLPRLDNILLMQLRIGILFPLFIVLGLRARGRDAGFHKRMMILAPATAIAAAIDRITWLPTTFPASPTATDLYVLLAISPMFIWDVFRNRRVHDAYWVWLGFCLPLTVAVHALWGTPWWYATAPRLMGV